MSNPREWLLSDLFLLSIFRKGRCICHSGRITLICPYDIQDENGRDYRKCDHYYAKRNTHTFDKYRIKGDTVNWRRIRLQPKNVWIPAYTGCKHNQNATNQSWSFDRCSRGSSGNESAARRDIGCSKWAERWRESRRWNKTESLIFWHHNLFAEFGCALWWGAGSGTVRFIHYEQLDSRIKCSFMISFRGEGLRRTALSNIAYY